MLVMLRSKPLRGAAGRFASKEWAGLSLGSLLLLSIALLVGLRGVLAHLSLFDDAYISLRYASNLAEGHGLVWNVGERVEGYTNFLWTVLIALLLRLTPLEAPLLALVLGGLVFILNLIVAAQLEERLLGALGSPTKLAFAPLLLALHSVFIAYGSTGMETGLCALLVSLGALALCGPWSGRGTLLAGAALIAATLCRPDHALFYVVGTAVVVLQELSLLRQHQARGEVLPLWASARRAALYAAPFTVYLAYLGWKLHYYGQLLPNTYYAKSADMSWYSQGLIYLLLFVIGTSAFVPLGLASVAWFRLRRRSAPAWQRFVLFSAGGTGLYCLYVAKVGGDFMHGRFVVSLIPLLFVFASIGVRSLAPWQRDRASIGRWLSWAIAAGLLVASVQPLPLFDGTQAHFGVVDESTYYRVTGVRGEVRVDHNHWKVGTFLRDKLTVRGIEPILGTGGIGMVGYYSKLPLVDVYGLTDPITAHRRLDKRRRPGHEKVATRSHLREQQVQLLRRKARQQGYHPRRFRKLTYIRFGDISDPWQLARYDRDLIAELRLKVPELRIRDFEQWLDGYIEQLPQSSPQQVSQDLPWLRRYYFDHNSDPTREQAITRAAAGSTLPPALSRPPKP